MNILKKLDRLYDYILLVIFLLCFLVGAYSMYDVWKVYLAANDDTLLNYKPGYDKQIDPVKPIVGNMVAWVEVEGTTIDYPIMQGTNNTEYLNQNPYGEYSLSGSIFLDYRNSDDFSDHYCLLYGHHMERGMMFGALDEYWKGGYIESHKNGTILFENGDKKPFKIFAVMSVDASESIVFSPGDGEGTLEYVNSHAKYIDSPPSSEKQLIALSTCKYPDTAERTVVVGYFE